MLNFTFQLSRNLVVLSPAETISVQNLLGLYPSLHLGERIQTGEKVLHVETKKNNNSPFGQLVKQREKLRRISSFGRLKLNIELDFFIC